MIATKVKMSHDWPIMTRIILLMLSSTILGFGMAAYIDASTDCKDLTNEKCTIHHCIHMSLYTAGVICLSIGLVGTLVFGTLVAVKLR